MIKLTSTIFILLFSLTACASTHQANLKISGDKFNFEQKIIISKQKNTLIEFTNTNGKKFNLSLKYKSLPANRSYPNHLDLLVRGDKGNKLSYLFFALNSLEFLNEVGPWGIISNIENSPVKFEFSPNSSIARNLQLDDLQNERFIQDTLMPNKGFQMIRPVILEATSKNQISKGFNLDNHPYYVEYKAIQLEPGLIEFQHNLYENIGSTKRLLKTIFFRAGSLDTIRTAMFAGKYFNTSHGPIKLVFYPALGQTAPNE